MIITIDTTTPRLVMASVRRQIGDMEAKCRKFNRDMSLRADLEELRRIEAQLVILMPEQAKPRFVDDDALWARSGGSNT